MIKKLRWSLETSRVDDCRNQQRTPMPPPGRLIVRIICPFVKALLRFRVKIYNLLCLPIIESLPKARRTEENPEIIASAIR